MGSLRTETAPGVWRHVRAVLALPFVAGALVPAAVIAAEGGPSPAWGLGGGAAAAIAAVGGVLTAAGLTLMAWTLRLFARVGRGTLAPWDPPARLVVQGPYAHVRNPMIAGVLALLAGEATILGSPGLLAWCGGFFVANWAFFVGVEEPRLKRRFGAEYRAYCANVPRWVPRRTPWGVERGDEGAPPGPGG